MILKVKIFKKSNFLSCPCLSSQRAGYWRHKLDAHDLICIYNCTPRDIMGHILHSTESLICMDKLSYGRHFMTMSQKRHAQKYQEDKLFAIPFPCSASGGQMSLWWVEPAPGPGTSHSSKLWFMVKRRGGQINCQINITNFSNLIKPSSKYHSSLHEVIPSRLDRLKVFWQSHQLPGVPPRRI